jgi:hypothetical protein
MHIHVLHGDLLLAGLAALAVKRGQQLGAAGYAGVMHRDRLGGDHALDLVGWLERHHCGQGRRKMALAIFLHVSCWGPKVPTTAFSRTVLNLSRSDPP